MASACVNNIGMPTETFSCPSSYGWLSPRISLSREFPSDDDSSKIPAENPSDPPESLLDPEPSAGDFEFRLEDPVAMLPADKLFADGKLMPLHLFKPSVNESTSPEIQSPESEKSRRRIEISMTDPYLFSPKAPRCSSRWRELLGLKRLYKSENIKTTSSSSSNASKSLKNFLNRSSKTTSSCEASMSLPLLKDSDSESVSISSRLSLSSSSSGPEHDDLPRHSLDSDKPNTNPISLHRNPNNPPRMKMVKPRSSENGPTATRMGRSPIRRPAGESSSGLTSRGVSVDSPRMNSSGKIVFQSLERSSSSPSSFNGGPRYKHRGMERSYSANVRVTPVLNVPVCSLRGSSKSGSVFGFGPLFSSQHKREGNNNGGNSKGVHHSHHHHQSNSRNRTESTSRRVT
ncbi:hypothetical protein UlMin_027548 [Ulmus minor]